MSEKQRPLVAWDCDDVLVLTGYDLIATYNERYDTRLQPGHLYTHDKSGVWGTCDTVASMRIEKLIREERHEMLSPEKEAILALNSLSKIIDSDVVTSRASAREHSTLRMLDTYYEGVFSQVHFANSYAPGVDASMRRTKGSICREIEADIAVDDNHLHIMSILAESSVKLAILYGNYEWNKDFKGDDSRIVRCSDMSAVRRKVSEFAEQYAA